MRWFFLFSLKRDILEQVADSHTCKHDSYDGKHNTNVFKFILAFYTKQHRAGSLYELSRVIHSNYMCRET